MLSLLTSPDVWVSLATLTLLEIVLGIDNVIFLSLVANRLPPERRPTARRTGLLLAVGLRVVFLSAVAWIIGLAEPVVTVWALPCLGATVITAVGMVEHLAVMIVAVVLPMIVMLVAAEPLAQFVERHPSAKMLALSFLILIGTALIADGMHFHIPRGYLYFAVGFSVAVEGLNQWVARKSPTAWVDLAGMAADDGAGAGTGHLRKGSKLQCIWPATCRSTALKLRMRVSWGRPSEAHLSSDTKSST